MNKNEIKKLLNSLYCKTLDIYPVSIRKELQGKIFEINEKLDK